MDSSILTSVKKILGIDDSYEAFDVDILMHINSVFLILQQLGIGPSTGFFIEDKTAKWSDFLGVDPNLNAVKTYVYLRVRLLFDPPQTTFHINAINEQIKELEWRLNVHREGLSWVPPEGPNLPGSNNFGDPTVLDGGLP